MRNWGQSLNSHKLSFKLVHVQKLKKVTTNY